MKNTIKISAAVALAVAGALSATAQAQSGPGFAYPGFAPTHPDNYTAGNGFVSVDSQASVSLIGPGTYLFSISATTPNTGTLNFGTSGSQWVIGNETVTLNEQFKKSGSSWVSNGGTYTITGNIGACSLGSSCPGGTSWSAYSGTLFSASIESGALSVDTGNKAIGLEANNFGGWAVTTANIAKTGTSDSLYLFASNGSGISNPLFTTGNSAWNSLITALSSGGSLSNGYYTNVGAYATVPLPGAALLLLSGLAGLGGMARRKPAAAA